VDRGGLGSRLPNLFKKGKSQEGNGIGNVSPPIGRVENERGSKRKKHLSFEISVGGVAYWN